MNIPPEITGAVIAGLITWGGIGVQLRWHRRDIDRADATAQAAARGAAAAHSRLDRINAPPAAGNPST